MRHMMSIDAALDVAGNIASFAEDNDGEVCVINYGVGVYQFVDVP